MPRRARLKLGAQAAAAAGVGVLAALLIWNLTHQTPPPKVGARAPDFSLRRLSGGGEISLASFRGKTVVLNFFASWCGPCKREAPALEALWRQYRSRGVVVLGVDSGDAAGDARRFVQAHGITYPIVSDPDQTLASNAYGVANLPATYVIDRAGRLVGSEVVGPISDKGYSSSFRRTFQAALTS
ncbi:MAG TPA: TlpA disulfide reductase family protein [Gaiellaceae bacterium]|nr:TlpA disulfide reductase family protein [Gaiellaceae bacterium]